MIALGLLSGDDVDDAIQSGAYKPYYMHRTSPLARPRRARRRPRTRRTASRAPLAPGMVLHGRARDSTCRRDDEKAPARAARHRRAHRRRRRRHRRRPREPDRGDPEAVTRRRSLGPSACRADPGSELHEETVRRMPDIESLLKEKRVFEPGKEFAKQANWSKRQVAALRKLGAKSPERFWAQMAKEHVSWFKPWKKVLDWKPPYAKWFVGAQTNVSYNCLDRHLEGRTPGAATRPRSSGKASPATRACSPTAQLHREVCKFANVLKGLGVEKGDRVAIYMPLMPGARRSRCSPARASARRTASCSAASRPSRCATASTTRARRSSSRPTAATGAAAPFALKPAVDEAVAGCPDVEAVVVVRAHRRSPSR